MTQKNSPSCTPFSVFYRHPKLMLLISLIGGLGVLSSSIVWAQTDSSIDTLGSSTTHQATRSAKPERERAAVRRRSVAELESVAVRRRRSVAEREPVAVRRRRSIAEREPVAVRRRSVAEGEPVAVRRRSIAEREPVAVRRRSIAEAEGEPTVVRRRLALEREPEADYVPKRQRLRPLRLSVPTTSEEVTPKSSISSPTDLEGDGRSATSQLTGAQDSVQASGDKNAYIDSTNYNIGATARANSRNGSYDEPTSVVLSERQIGCRRSGGVCGSVARIPSRNIYSARETAKLPSRNANGISRHRLVSQPDLISRRQTVVGDVETGNFPSLQNRRRVALRAYPTDASVASIREVNVGPLRLSSSGMGVSNRHTPDAQDDSTQTPVAQTGNLFSSQPSFPRISLPGSPDNVNISFIFPLSLPAPITSIFGWRVHPITGDRRFHAGTDLGAPLGAPVLAAYAGQVAVANWMGGYGLAVVLQHNQTQETLYGHLSELFVQPGQWVEQGTVIGRVGSTGNSTGPHLHFEWRHMTSEGWVATDPGTQLQYAVAQLMQALQTAQLTPQPNTWQSGWIAPKAGGNAPGTSTPLSLASPPAKKG